MKKISLEMVRRDNVKVGIIYSQLIEEFGFGYFERDLWMIAENIYEKIVSQQPQLNDDQKMLCLELEEWRVQNEENIN